MLLFIWQIQTEVAVGPEKYSYPTGNDNDINLKAKVKSKLLKEKSQGCFRLSGKSQTEIGLGPKIYLYPIRQRGRGAAQDIKVKVNQASWEKQNETSRLEASCQVREKIIWKVLQFTH